jgi:hypothetical protein
MRTFESEPMQMPMLREQTRSTGRNPSPRSASVVRHAQMRAPARASRSSSAPSACVAWTTGRAFAEAARAVEAARWADAVLGEALLDLARLLVGVDVQRQTLRGCVAPDLLEPVRGARAHGVGGKPDGDAAAAQVLDLAQVLDDRLLPKARQPATAVRARSSTIRTPASSAASIAASASSKPR